MHVCATALAGLLWWLLWQALQSPPQITRQEALSVTLLGPWLLVVAVQAVLAATPMGRQE